MYCELLLSTDSGANWSRLAPHAQYIPHGANGAPDSHTVYAAARPLAAPHAPGTTLLYYAGGHGPHSGPRRNYWMLATAPSSALAGHAGPGAVTTRPLEEVRRRWGLGGGDSGGGGKSGDGGGGGGGGDGGSDGGGDVRDAPPALLLHHAGGAVRVDAVRGTDEAAAVLAVGVTAAAAERELGQGVVASRVEWAPPAAGREQTWGRGVRLRFTLAAGVVLFALELLE